MKKKLQYTITGVMEVDPDTYEADNEEEDATVESIIENEQSAFEDAPGAWLTAVDDTNDSPTIQFEAVTA